MFVRLVMALFSGYAMAATVSGKVIIKNKHGDQVKDQSGVVVFVDGLKEEKPTAGARVIQKDKLFVPAVLPIVVGSEVAFPNEDSVLHNVFSLSKTQPF